jgi:creatinine amidohydrolase
MTVRTRDDRKEVMSATAGVRTLAPSPAPPPSRRLAAAVWPSVPEGALVLVPVGSTEQHGPHLPLSTDTLIATSVAERAAARLPDPVLVAPAIPVGASGEHAGFPGTLSIGHEALSLMLVETVRSLALWAGRIVFVNGHGGNSATLRDVVTRMRGEGHSVAWTPCAPPGADAHAGRAETSVMLRLFPHLVHLAAAEQGETRPIAELLPQLRARGVRALSPNGVLGDPTGATAGEGERLLASMAEDVIERARESTRPEHRY